MKFLILALAVLGTSQAFDLCPICCKVMDFVQQEETRDESKEIAFINAECGKLGGFKAKICEGVFDNVLKFAASWFEKESDVKLCQDIKVCSSSDSCSSLPSFVDTAVKGSGQACAVLQKIKKMVDDDDMEKACDAINQYFHLNIPCADIEQYKTYINIALEIAEKQACKSDMDVRGYDVCEILTIAEKDLNEEMVEEGCEEVEKLIPSIKINCKKVAKQYEPVLKQAIAAAKAALRCSSASLMDMIDFDANSCHDLEIAAKFFKDDGLRSICNDIDMGASTCAILGRVDKVLADVLTFACNSECSSAAHVSYAELLHKYGDDAQTCQILAIVGRILQSQELDDLCKKDMSNSQLCAVLSAMEKYALMAIRYMGESYGCQ